MKTKLSDLKLDPERVNREMRERKETPLRRVMVADRYTYETDLPVQVGDMVRLPCGEHAKGKTWVAKVTCLTSHYTGPCKRIMGFASEQV